MARQEIILGTPPTGLGGDTPRVASSKINAMTLEIYQGIGTPAAPLPLERGGTGGKTQATAQAALGLVPVGATNDVNPGRLMTVGYGGVGGQLQNRSNTPDAALTLMSGASFSYGGQGGSYPTGATDGALISLSYETTGSFVYQMLGDWRTGYLHRRGRAAGTSGAWAMIYDTVNISLDPSNGGILKRTVVGGIAITKYADGRNIANGTFQANTASLPAGSTVVSIALPFSIGADDGFSTANIVVQPSNTYDHYGAISAYITSGGTVLNVAIRNGAGAQTFKVSGTIMGHWK
ncbi:hypothetical protein [Pseudomonas veronii]|uniref:hypothetical protein n=1 Tax=Pseudomonas veronii TaxID=76761 RepID=UPI000A937060|nr:hypothetical protein [Pseudomonas veronii]